MNMFKLFKGLCACALIVLCGVASARTMTVTPSSETELTLTFDQPCDREYVIGIGYGVTDGGADKYAWTSFAKAVTTVASNATTCTVSLPAAVVAPGNCYRLFLMQIADLPYSTERTYIQSNQKNNQTQYIKTGIKGNAGVKVESDLAIVESADTTMVGSRSGGVRFFPIHVNGYSKWSMGYNGFHAGSQVLTLEKRVHAVGVLKSGSQSLTIDGVSSYSAAEGTYNTDLEMYIFAANINGSASQKSKFRLYNMNIYTNDVLARAYFPVLRTNGWGGLCDGVECKEYGNAGDGSFTVGPIPADEANRRGIVKSMSSACYIPGLTIVEKNASSVTLKLAGSYTDCVLYLASGTTDGRESKYAWDDFDKLDDIAAGQTVTRTYTIPEGKRTGRYHRFFLLRTTDLPYARELEYLQSTSTSYGGNKGTQFIDTGIIGKSGTKMECNYVWLAGSDSTILGSRKGNTRFYVSQMYYNKYWCTGYNSWGYTYAVTYDTSLQGKNLHLICELNKGKQTLFVNDQQVYSTTQDEDVNTDLNMYVFGCNWDGAQKVCIKAKLFDMKIWQDGGLKRQFRPVVLSSGKGALVDELSATVFTNGSSTDFVVGELDSSVEAARRGIVKAVSMSIPPEAVIAYDSAVGKQTMTASGNGVWNLSNFTEAQHNSKKLGVESFAFEVDGGVFNDTTTANMLLGNGFKDVDVTLKSGSVSAYGLQCQDGYKDPAAYHEKFTMDGGTLNINGGSICAWTRFDPFCVFNNGTVNALANWSVEFFRTPIFGEQSGGKVELNVADKTVNWATGLAGTADVNLKGSGTFKSGIAKDSNTAMRFQGVLTGAWTIENTGVNDLTGAAAFQGGLHLTNDVTAALNIAGSNLVQAVFLEDVDFDTAKGYGSYEFPFVCNDLSFLHATGSATDYTTASVIWQGQFYADTAGTWTFATGYDDKANVTIDGTSVVDSTTWNAVAKGTVSLSVGWHDFKIVQYQNGGGWGTAAADWKNVMNVGFAKSEVEDVAATNYVKFDGQNLPLRARLDSLKWRSVANYDANTWKTRTDLKDNGVFKMSRLHTYKLAATPTFAASTHEFEGWVYVTPEQAGNWKILMSYDDQGAIWIDGVDTGASGASKTATVDFNGVTAGWHSVRIRVADNAGDWGPWSNAGAYCKITVNGTEYKFDETNFRFSPVYPRGDFAGLDGVVQLDAGSTLVNDATVAACPIWGTLKGTGTLSGKFAFMGDDNCWEVSSGIRSKDFLPVKFANADSNALAGLKKIKVIFSDRPRSPCYDLGDALGANVANIAIEAAYG